MLTPTEGESVSTSSGPRAGKPTTRVEVVDDNTKVRPSATRGETTTHRPIEEKIMPTQAKRRQPPEGAILPDRGWPKVRYGVNCFFGRPDKVPAVTAEQWAEIVAATEKRAAEELRARISERMYRVWWLDSIPELKLRALFTNIMGSASKTTTGLYVGTIIAMVTNKQVLILPTTNNTATSSVAQMAGVPKGKVLSVTQCSDLIDQLPEYTDVSDRIPRTRPYGLGVLSEDPDDSVNVSNDYDTKQFCALYGALDPKFDVILLDAGNDNIRNGTIPLEAARRATVIVFTSTAFLGKTVSKIRPTMNLFLTDIDAKPEGYQGKFIPTPEKVRNSIIVTSGLWEGVEVDFDKLLKGTDERDPELSEEYEFKGRPMTIRSDPYMDRRDGTMPVCNIDAIQPETLLEYLELTVACYEQAAKVQGISLDGYVPMAYEDVVREEPLIRPTQPA